MRQYLENLVEFYRVFLSNSEKYRPPALFHYVLSDILLHSDKNFAVEGFRDSAKTELVIIAYPTYLIFTRKEDMYVMLIKENQEMASEKLVELRNRINNHPVLKETITEEKAFKTQPKGVWEIVNHLGARMRFEAYGKGTSIRGAVWQGRRPDLIILDDIQSYKDLESERLLEKTWNWFLSDIKFLSNEARIFLIGNNLGEKCVIERAFQSAEKFNFKTLRIPALINDGDRFYSTWASRFSVEELLNEREAYTKENKLNLWMRERMCEVTAEESQIFKDEWFTHYDIKTLQQIVKKANVFTSVDIATTEKKESDYTAIVTVAVTDENLWYVLDVRYGNWNIDTTIEQLFGVVEKFRPVKVGIERGALNNVLKPILKREMMERNLHFLVHDVSYGQRSKKSRIEGLAPLYANNWIFHPSINICPQIIELEEELLKFPFAGHDDVADAMANFQFFVYAPNGSVGALQSSLSAPRL